MSGMIPLSPILPRSFPGCLLAWSKNNITSEKFFVGNGTVSGAIWSLLARASSKLTTALFISVSSKVYSTTVERSPSCFSKRAWRMPRFAPLLPAKGFTNSLMSSTSSDVTSVSVGLDAPTWGSENTLIDADRRRVKSETMRATSIICTAPPRITAYGTISATTLPDSRRVTYSFGAGSPSGRWCRS